MGKAPFLELSTEAAACSGGLERGCTGGGSFAGLGNSCGLEGRGGGGSEEESRTVRPRDEVWLNCVCRVVAADLQTSIEQKLSVNKL